MTDKDKSKFDTIKPAPATESTRLPERGGMKTNQSIVDGGNMEDSDSAFSNPDNPVLEENVTDSNLSVERDEDKPKKR